jgi:RHS repeat-associated protein
MVTDENANVVGRHDYLPFGEEIAANAGGRDSTFGTQDFVNQKFTGQERDVETGLDFFHARYFSAALGRFNSPDPGNAGANLFNPQSWNAYSYVANNPLTLTDPTGMDPQCQPGASWFGEGCYGGGGGAGASLPSGANPYLVEGSQGAVNTGSNLGGGSGNLSAAENKYASNFVWKASGLVYGKAYNQYFSSLDAYFDWRTGIAALGESKAYNAYMADCIYSSVSCGGDNIVVERDQGPTGNYRLEGSVLDTRSMSGMILDPLYMLPVPASLKQYFHPGASWYNWGPVDTLHVAGLSNGVESHQDLFNPVYFAPLHFVFDVVPSFFINPSPGRVVATYVCSPVGGCHR